LTHPDEEIQAKAAEVLAGTTDENRAKIVKQYIAEVAALASGSDAGRGREAFAKHCSGCHRVQDQGFEVGPDLAALTTRSASGLIESIYEWCLLKELGLRGLECVSQKSILMPLQLIIMI